MHIEGLSDPVRLAHRLTGTVVPRFAQSAAVHLIVELLARPEQPLPPSGRLLLRRVASAGAHRDVLPTDEIVRWPQEGPALTSLARGESVHIPHMDAGTADHLAAQLSAPALARTMNCASVLLLPLATGGSTFGNVLLIRDADRPPFTEAEIAVFAEHARWTAEWIENSRLCRQEHRIAGELRRGARPDIPARSGGVELGYRYQPESKASQLGGDWFDAIALPGGRTALVVGDVAGHGAEAAVLMSQCKTMVRTLASLDLAPDQLLRRFDPLVRRLGEEHGTFEELLATCLYAVYDPAARQCVVASAGHVPPVLVRPDGHAEVLRPPSGVPLGVGGVPFESRTFDAPDGSLLALCTDGLVETGDHDIEEGLRIVGGRLAGPGRDLERICDEIMGRLAPDQRRDDVTLLVARLLGTREAVPASPVPAAPSPAPHLPALHLTPAPAPGTPPAARPEWSNLPEEATSFVGRRHELAQIRRLIGSARLVTLTGPPGVGKSRLARHAVAGLRGEFPDGVRLVNLSALRDPDLLLPTAVSAALGIGGRQARAPLDLVMDHLAGMRLLLVLDDCEHLVAGCAELATALLRSAPHLRILATARRPLRVAGEHTLVVSPLPVLDLDGDALSRSDAVLLFVERARAAAPGFVLPAAELPTVRHLCARLDGLPLAIELAAGRLRSMSADDLVAGLDDRFELLTGQAPGNGRRHQTLRGSIGRSHELCEPLERLLWARLSMFADDFDLVAAELVCADETLPRSEVLQVLSELVDESVVLREKGAAGPRYRMLESIREYGRQHLSRLPEHGAMLRQHSAWHRQVTGHDGLG